jgi:hypothetical protein
VSAAAFDYRPGVRADGSYINNVWGRIARAVDTQPERVAEAVRLFSEWTGRATDATDARRLAHLIGCGYPPSAAAARELGYRLTRGFAHGNAIMGIGL